MSDRGEMNADLMSAPSLWNGANQREAIAVGCRSSDFAQDRSCETFLDAKVGDGFRAFGMNRLLQPNRRRLMLSLPIHRRVDRFRFPIRPSPNDREIFFVQTPLLHEQSESSRGGRSFRDQYQTARLAIEAIDDRDLAAIRNFEREQLAQLLP